MGLIIFPVLRLFSINMLEWDGFITAPNILWYR